MHPLHTDATCSLRPAGAPTHNYLTATASTSPTSSLSPMTPPPFLHAVPYMGHVFGTVYTLCLQSLPYRRHPLCMLYHMRVTYLGRYIHLHMYTCHNAHPMPPPPSLHSVTYVGHLFVTVYTSAHVYMSQCSPHAAATLFAFYLICG